MEDEIHQYFANRSFFNVEKGPAADVTDAPQPWGLLYNPVMKMKRKMINFVFTFPSNEAPEEWNWQGKTEILGEKPVTVPLCPPQIPMEWPGIEPGPPRWEAVD